MAKGNIEVTLTGDASDLSRAIRDQLPHSIDRGRDALAAIMENRVIQPDIRRDAAEAYVRSFDPAF